MKLVTVIYLIKNITQKYKVEQVMILGLIQAVSGRL